MKILIAIILGMSLFDVVSCNRHETVEQPIVQVGERVLTKNDLMQALPKNIGLAEDSSVLANDYIRSWVNYQVMLQKAEANLTDEERDIEEAVRQYRQALLTERYQRKLIKQNFKPNITSYDIEEYYNEMKSNFRLNETIMKGAFIVLPKTIIETKNSRKDYEIYKKILSAPTDENYSAIEEYVYQNSMKFNISMDKWMTVQSFEKFIPQNVGFKSNDVKYHKLIELQDDSTLYLIMPIEHKLADDIAPVEFVQKDIYTILVNKKRLEFIKDLEKDIYDEAMNNNSIKYYNIDNTK